MGERAFEREATPDDLIAMKRELRSGIRAGAIGFTTSRTRNHQTPDGHPVASRLANWDEVRQLVGVLGEENAGLFEIAGEDTGLEPERIQEYLDRLKGARGRYARARDLRHVQHAQGARLLASVFQARR